MSNDHRIPLQHNVFSRDWMMSPNAKEILFPPRLAVD